MSKIKLSKEFIKSTVKLALNEDLYPSGDITSGLIKDDKFLTVKLISNQSAIVGGLLFAKQTFALIDDKIKFIIKKKDGSRVKKGNLVALIKGNAKNILIAERVALNFLSHISGIATKTNEFVKLAGKKTKICCTRKTTPNLRLLEKYAVRQGGGFNHRYNLSDEILIKDNHIVVTKDLRKLVFEASKSRKVVTVEIENIEQLKKILGIKFKRVLFDNMDISKLKKCLKLCNNKYETEYSGNANLKNIKRISKTGVNRISVGSITHSAKAFDTSLLLG